MCGQKNPRATARDKIGQYKDTPSSSKEIEISDPAGNRTLAAGLEGTYGIRVTTMYNFYFRATLGVKEVLQSSNNST